MKISSTLVLALCARLALAQYSHCDFLKALDSEIQCGYAVVPEDHQLPTGKKIKIAYAVLKSRNKNTHQLPVVFLNGGPGGISIASIEQRLDHPILEQHDFILFDQRGTGFSSPLPNPAAAFLNILAGNHTVEEEYQLLRDSLEFYKKKCAQQQLQLNRYITSQNAADVNKLMQHLGYTKYILYGESYGTRLARVVMEQFPDRVDCAILDGPAVLESDFLSFRLKNFNDGLEKIFNYCENDPTCKARYPSLRKDYVDAVKALEKNPLRITIGNEPFWINPQDALFLLRYQLYASSAKTRTPAFIKALKTRDVASLNASLQFLQGFVGSTNFGMFLSVERNEEYDNMMSDKKIEMLYTQLPNLPAKLGFFNSLYLAAGSWHAETLTAEQKKMKNCSIPALIFVNKYDPVTPPKNGAVFKETLPNGKLFVLDMEGHGVSGDCAIKVMLDFIKKPAKPLDASCLPLAK